MGLHLLCHSLLMCLQCVAVIHSACIAISCIGLGLHHRVHLEYQGYQDWLLLLLPPSCCCSMLVVVVGYQYTSISLLLFVMYRSAMLGRGVLPQLWWEQRLH
jgi:hypothetical protein